MRSPSSLFLSFSRQIASSSCRRRTYITASHFPRNTRSSSSTPNSNPAADVTPANPVPSSSGSSSTEVSPKADKATGSNLNGAIIEMLKQHRDEEWRKPGKNTFKVGAFTKAIKVISSLDYPVRTAAQAIILKGVGPRITQRIAKFLDQEGEYGVGISEESREADRDRRVQLALEGVPGIGKAKARALAQAGCRSLEDLKKPQFQKMLSSSQRIAAEYEEHVRQPVTREESEAVLNFLKRNMPSNYSMELVGTYRRGLPTSSSIEILLYHPDHVLLPRLTLPPPTLADYAPSTPRAFFSGALPAKARDTNLLYRDFVQGMETRGLISCTKMIGASKWQGVVRVPKEDETRWDCLAGVKIQEGTYRMLTVYFAPQKSVASALLALTGDADFLRHLRLRASESSMHFDEYGLWKWDALDDDGNGSGTADGSEADEDIDESSLGRRPKGLWKLSRAQTEAEILDELGLAWLEPERRNFAYISNSVKSK